MIDVMLEWFFYVLIVHPDSFIHHPTAVCMKRRS